MHIYHLEVVAQVAPPWPKLYGVRKVITDSEARSGGREIRDMVEAMAWAELNASLSQVGAKIERIPRAGWRTETLGEDNAESTERRGDA